MRTAWICTECQAGSVGEFAHIQRAEHEQWTAHRTQDADPRWTRTMLDDICIREDIIAPLLERKRRSLVSKKTDLPSPGEGVPQLVMAPAGREASGGEQPGEGDFWKGEICKRCMRRNCVGFDVPDEIWQAVVRDRWNVLCTTCFDEEAQAARVAYRFGKVWPVSWSMWGTGEDGVS